MFRSVSRFFDDPQWRSVMAVLLFLVFLYGSNTLGPTLGLRLDLKYSIFVIWVLSSWVLRWNGRFSVSLGLVFLILVPVIMSFETNRRALGNGVGFKESLADQTASLAFLFLIFGLLRQLWSLLRCGVSVEEDDF